MLINQVLDQIECESKSIYMHPDFYFNAVQECLKAEGEVSCAVAEFLEGQTLQGLPVFTAFRGAHGRCANYPPHPDFVVV